MKKFAIFDIDGTIFRSSLLIELTDSFIQEGVFPETAKKVYAKSFKDWLDRKDTYDKYIMGVVRAFENNIKGIKHKDFLKISKKVISFHQNRVYRYTRDLVLNLRKKGYFILAISNSPKEILDEFCNKWGFNKVYGRIYEVDSNGRLTGKTLFKEIISDKAKVLKRAIEKEGLTLKNSIGVGDSESDVPFLKMVQRPICFNPNKILFEKAKRAKWEVIVERKNVIYKL